MFTMTRYTVPMTTRTLSLGEILHHGHALNVLWNQERGIPSLPFHDYQHTHEAEVLWNLTDNDVIWCEWFAGCNNPAETFESHPILVSVPCCARCLERVS